MMEDLRTTDDSKSLWLLFLVWPLAALAESIRNYRQVWAKNGLWMFIVFFGFTFVARDQQDSMAYLRYFQELHWSGAGLGSFTLLDEDSGKLDIYQPLVALLVAQFTGDYRILFAVFALVFGYFYTRNIWMVLGHTRGRLNPFAVGMIIIFALVVPFWYINGVRFWTAAQVFLFGSLLYLLQGKRVGILIASLSVLVHFSFTFPVMVLFLYLLLGNRTTIYLILFVGSSFVSEINIPAFRAVMIAYTPSMFHGTIENYTRESYIAVLEKKAAGRNWYVEWHTRALRFALDILVLLAFIRGRELWRRRKEMLRLLSFMLLFGALAKVLSTVPSVGRFLTVLNLFIAAFLFLYFYHRERDTVTRTVCLALVPAFALFLVVTMRVASDNINLFAVISNPVIVPFVDNDTALIDLIKPEP